MRFKSRLWLLVSAAALLGTGASASEVQVANYGVTKDGQTVRSYTLVNDKGASATILDYGGAVAAIRVPDRKGQLGNVVMSMSDLAGWETMGHANSLVGRYANRLRNGFTLDGVHYPLQPNAKGVTIHGGTVAYTRRVWTALPINKKDGAAVTLTLDSPDGDQGFPGHLKVKATYRFTNDNALRLDFEAVTDKATVINLTNHIYFNLNGNSTTPIYTHDLQVMADQVAVKDADSVPTGEMMEVKGTPFDLTMPTLLADRIAAATDPAFATPGPNTPPAPAGKVLGYDHSFIIRKGLNRLDKVSARLHDPASGRVLELRTTEPTMQVYTPAGARAGLLSDVGKPFVLGPTVALETQHLPDSPNLQGLPTTILRPGETFRSTTIFGFTTDKR
ncbi:MAG: galactose mutarotase [Caulobacteraceae bacterium]|jgi:aldose 1-epimerase|nr:galactose mutarotase [Caulobacteraceae bacterium]